MRKILIAAILLQSACTSQTAIIKEETNVSASKEEAPVNIILMIGDGMGVPQISTAFYFEDRTSNFERFKSIGFHKSSSTSHWITDSAAGATAFSIGEKTYKRAIGVSADTVPKETILEKLQNKGYKTGLISLTSITHATPASFYAHVKDRDLHEEIAEQLAVSNVDFFAGGGKKYFNQRKDAKNLFLELANRQYNVDTLALTKPNASTKNAFILTEEGLPSKIDGRGDFLKEATENALHYFDQANQPFFMMIEGSYIDWGGHAENAEMVISEVSDFDRTLGAVLDFVESHPNTLLVVTADHETGGVSVGKFYETDKESGKKTEVPQKVGVYFNTDQHSGELIPVFAKGKGAHNFQGIYENSEIYHHMMKVIMESE
ncbi:alkaline phosphatase [Maribacter sp. 1_2014MBL_MicDiv]|uniref:alkaline phosphatase n=1 Tax=Maribacter sp. 1_2014MBL_MicDiv TaxID=1644130 RepID=UPI0008F51434|nr:alkaline phosphatase [Maribacter sp. 1_2014MBL_MicDiv]APA65021.1 alkaline phosphatase [Maribacter sp. 1_2014MBL_MicDiv]